MARGNDKHLVEFCEVRERIEKVTSDIVDHLDNLLDLDPEEIAWNHVKWAESSLKHIKDAASDIGLKL